MYLFPFPFPSIPIYSFGPPSPIFLPEEVHSILYDLCLEPLPLVGVETLPADLSSPGIFYLEYSSSSHGGGLGTGVLLPGPEYFVSRVLEDPIGRSGPIAGVSTSSSCR